MISTTNIRKPIKGTHINDKYTLTENKINTNTTDGFYISTQYSAWHHRRQFHIYILYTCFLVFHAI